MLQSERIQIFSFLKKIFFSLVVLYVVGVGIALAQQERVTNYDIQIEVKRDSSLLITETISVYAAGRSIERGIYRDFPTHYSDRRGIQNVVGFDVIEVLKNGQIEPYHVKAHANGERVYIGDQNVFLSPGMYTYTLKFKTTFQLGFFEDHDELYFNAIGHGWMFPIESGSVSVLLPSGIAASDISADGFTGVMGSQAKDFHLSLQSNSLVRYKLTRGLRPKEGFTVVVSWPKGFVMEPSGIELFVAFVLANIDNLIGVLGLFMVWLFYVLSWWRVGKDPDKGTILPRFEPPDGITPHGARYLLDMGYSKRLLTACLYHLAISGRVRINEQEGEFTLFQIGEKDSKPKGDGSIEDQILSILFPFGMYSQKVDSKNWRVFKQASDELKKNLQKKHLKKTFYRNQVPLYIGVVFSVLLVLLMRIAVGSEPDNLFDFINIGIFTLLFLSAMAFKILVKAPTKAGRKIMDEIEGYKMYLKTAEADRLGGLAPKEITKELYEKHLPYAVALGVDQEWTKRFEHDLSRRGSDPDSYHPVWYRGSRLWNDRTLFGKGIGDALNSSIASSSSPPGSRSGGGGSSGGGGGGGGGGGW